MKKSLLSLITAFAIVLLVGCSSEPEQFQDTNTDLFDTVITVTGFTESQEDFDETLSGIYGDMEYYDHLFDIYNNYDGMNNIKTINDNAGVKPVDVDQPVIDLLLLAKDMNEKTDGNVNAAMGSVLRLWHEAREYGLDHPENAYLPNVDELEVASQHTDFNQIVIDESESTVFIKDPDVRIDVGAVAKGFATQNAAKALADSDISGFLINAGGNVNCVGSKPDGSPWNVAIENPVEEGGNYPAVLQLEGGMSAVTSGSYQRFYTVGGKRYHHIIDPATLFPNDTFASITVVSHDSAMGDALSTALFNMSYEDGKALINSMDDFEAMWILNDGTIKNTEGFNEYIAE